MRNVDEEGLDKEGMKEGTWEDRMIHAYGFDVEMKIPL
jgi:hypothetical protein